MIGCLQPIEAAVCRLTWVDDEFAVAMLDIILEVAVIDVAISIVEGT